MQENYEIISQKCMQKLHPLMSCEMEGERWRMSCCCSWHSAIIAPFCGRFRCIRCRRKKNIQCNSYTKLSILTHAHVKLMFILRIFRRTNHHQCKAYAHQNNRLKTKKVLMEFSNVDSHKTFSHINCSVIFVLNKSTHTHLR